jgi:hypothetical protein
MVVENVLTLARRLHHPGCERPKVLRRA